MKKTNWLVAAIIIAAAIIIVIIAWPRKPAADTSSTSTDNSSQTAGLGVQLASKQGLANFMTDSRGMTLYYYPKDNIGKSNCYGGCAVAWPIFYSENLSVAAPLNKEDFTAIARSDGSKQTSYKGWPLYYYQKDLNPGETLGEGVGNIWYIMPEPFYTVMAQNQESAGTYLTNEKAIAIYYFTNDTRGSGTSTPVSNCTGQCLVNWPIVTAGEVIAPSLLKKSDFTALNRADGTKQLVYKGWPLYYFAGDKNPGEINGQGVNNVWFLAKP
ncbi:MAG: hypothetical protein Q7R92_03935 [bacterium]|nr:hypothetical protein [bacterium]